MAGNAEAAPEVEEGSPFVPLRLLLREEVERAVQQHFVSSPPAGPHGGEEAVERVVRRARLAWDGLTTSSAPPGPRRPSQGSSGLEPQLCPKWAGILQAKYGRLGELTKELQRMQDSFAASTLQCKQEEEYLKGLGLLRDGGLGGESPGPARRGSLASRWPSPSKPQAREESPDTVSASYLADLESLAHSAALLRTQAEERRLRASIVEDRTILEEQLHAARQARRGARARRRLELERLQQQLEDAGVFIEIPPLVPESRPPSPLMPGGAIQFPLKVQPPQSPRPPSRQHPDGSRQPSPQVQLPPTPQKQPKQQQQQQQQQQPQPRQRTSPRPPQRPPPRGLLAGASPRQLPQRRAMQAGFGPEACDRTGPKTGLAPLEVAPPAFAAPQSPEPADKPAWRRTPELSPPLGRSADLRDLRVLRSTHHVVGDAGDTGQRSYWLVPQ